MDNHKEENQGFGKMWAMMLCCALPILLIIVFGTGGKALGVPTWAIFGGVVVMIIAHLFMMGRPRKHLGEKHEMIGEEDKNKDDKNNKTHSSHGCCP